jgi:peroxiredoxin
MEPAAAPSAHRRSPELWAGVVLCTLLAVLLVLGGTDVVSHRGELRPLVPGDTAPEFSLPTPSMDTRIALSSLRGKVVLMDFWATWCAPCLREMPELATLHDSLKDQGFTVLAVNREPEDTQAVKRFVIEKRLPFPVVVDNDSVGERYRIVSLPMTVLLDRHGVIIRQFMGYTPPAVLRSAVEAALKPTG